MKLCNPCTLDAQDAGLIKRDNTRTYKLARCGVCVQENGCYDVPELDRELTFFLPRYNPNKCHKCPYARTAESTTGGESVLRCTSLKTVCDRGYWIELRPSGLAEYHAIEACAVMVDPVVKFYLKTINTLSRAGSVSNSTLLKGAS